MVIALAFDESSLSNKGRSACYRVMTRAQMLLILVGAVYKGGFFEWLKHMKFSPVKLIEDKGAKKINCKAAKALVGNTGFSPKEDAYSDVSDANDETICDGNDDVKGGNDCGDGGGGISGSNVNVGDRGGASHPSLPIHIGIICDKSNISPIVGVRYTILGADYDICADEFEKLIKNEKMRYHKISIPGEVPIPCLDDIERSAEQSHTPPYPTNIQETVYGATRTHIWDTSNNKLLTNSSELPSFMPIQVKVKLNCLVVMCYICYVVDNHASLSLSLKQKQLKAVSKPTQPGKFPCEIVKVI